MLVDRLVASAVWCGPALASVELPFNGVSYVLFQCIAGGGGELGGTLLKFDRNSVAADCYLYVWGRVVTNSPLCVVRA